jgi:tetratricopeptide (TPR) repeat protein
VEDYYLRDVDGNRRQVKVFFNNSESGSMIALEEPNNPLRYGVDITVAGLAKLVREAEGRSFSKETRDSVYRSLAVHYNSDYWMSSLLDDYRANNIARLVPGPFRKYFYYEFGRRLRNQYNDDRDRTVKLLKDIGIEQMGVIMAGYDAAVHFLDAPRYSRKSSQITDQAITSDRWSDALLLRDKLNEEAEHFRRILGMNPDDAEAHCNLAGVLSSQGKLEEAITHYRLALQNKQNFTRAHSGLGIALYRKGRLDEAIGQFNRAVELEPDNLESLNGLSWLLATHPDTGKRDVQRAIKLAERGCELTKRRDAVTLRALATAYGAAGRFDEAITAAEAALALVDDNKGLADDMRRQLEYYKQKQP